MSVLEEGRAGTNYLGVKLWTRTKLGVYQNKTSSSSQFLKL